MTKTLESIDSQARAVLARARPVAAAKPGDYAAQTVEQIDAVTDTTASADLRRLCYEASGGLYVGSPSELSVRMDLLAVVGGYQQRDTDARFAELARSA